MDWYDLIVKPLLFKDGTRVTPTPEKSESNVEYVIRKTEAGKSRYVKAYNGYNRGFKWTWVEGEASVFDTPEAAVVALYHRNQRWSNHADNPKVYRRNEATYTYEAI